MRAAFFYHSLISDWNHGNAHFLRGVVRELTRLGHEVRVFEPEDGWSRQNLIRDHGMEAINRFKTDFPGLRSQTYRLETLDLERALNGVELILAHEWNDPALIARLGRYRKRHRSCRLLFHDTHHRAVTAPAEMKKYDLQYYDGVLAFGEVLRQIYIERGWTSAAWTWHEAADGAVFRPQPGRKEWDVVWVGNWGDEERTEELQEYFFDPVQALGLKACVHGVRYPQAGLDRLRAAGIAYRGWLANRQVPTVFARHRMTLHIPRRPYREQLPGIPTIRVFEALACGIPLVSAPWEDAEKLFRVGEDFLMARDGREMREHIALVRNDASVRQALARNGLQTINNGQTCAHRVQELLVIAQELGLKPKVKEVA